MAFATINEDTFYMQGGITNGPEGPTLNQFYTLDLTQPTWPASTPPWKAHAYSGEGFSVKVKNYRHSISISPDMQTLTFWVTYPGLVLNYSIPNDAWTEVPKPAQLSLTGDLHAVTDPTTGLVYIPAAYNNVSMGVYNPATQEFTARTMPLPNAVANDRWYSFVRSEVRNSFIFFGNNPTKSTNPFSEFTPPNKWTNLVRFLTCLVDCALMLNGCKHVVDTPWAPFCPSRPTYL
jgi:hypothetical protein